MKKLSFEFETRLLFSEEIKNHYFTLKFLPISVGSQKICSVEYDVSPMEHVDQSTDCFGNTIISGRMIAPHDHFSFRISGIAFTDQKAVCMEKLHPVFRYESPYTQYAPSLVNFYREHIEGLEPAGGAVEHARKIMDAVYAVMSYVPGSTTVKTTASQALEQRMGVCQDYAHICIALLRKAGIPARYAAGLIVGEGQSHAWVEVYETDHWVGIDPTHNCMVNEDYIRISVGRDYGDCMVERGIFTGIAEQNQIVSVKVTEY